ncbi:MAG: hypothetical protein ACI8R4_001745 [Paracoccaceae bacterium]|jgi:hypothetical protein
MRITRIIAFGVFLASAGLNTAHAQALRAAQPPAEFPAASYKGKQYVDSRGCIYIRAGIDGNVTWIPRVDRGRKQVCGYKPTVTAKIAATPAPQSNTAPVIITIAPTPGQVAKPAPNPVAVAKPAPRVATAPAPRVAKPVNPSAKPNPKPAATVFANSTPKAKTASKPAAVVLTSPAKATGTPSAKPSSGPEPTVWANSAPAAAKPKPAPTAAVVQRKPVVIAAPVPSTVAAPAPALVQTRRQAPTEKCANASAFSQQFINDPAGRRAVRCGPQTEPPIAYAQPVEDHSTLVAPSATSPSPPSVPQSVSSVPPGTRVVARHVYDKRQNTTNFTVPKGYRSVWTDDRLNPNRTERTLKPAQVQGVVSVPRGYKLVDWDDNRLNLRRGIRTAAGDAQSDQVWSRTTPRTPVAVPTRAQIVTVPAGSARVQDERSRARYSPFARISTRSAPVTAPVTAPVAAGQKSRYVRVATYAADAPARSAAQSLGGLGLPIRLGTLKPSGKRVVLAGPFTSDAQAKAALNRVRGAGYSGAKLSK